MNRYAAANRASNWTASASQGRQLLSLTKQFKAALAALSGAGHTFARDLLSRHLNWLFTKQDAQRAILGVLSLLHKRGLTRKAIARYAGGSLTAHKFDVLRQLNGL